MVAMAALPRRKWHERLILVAIGGASGSIGFTKSRQSWRHEQLGWDRVVAVNFADGRGSWQRVEKQKKGWSMALCLKQ